MMYRTTKAQTIEAGGYSCVLPAGVRFEDREELEPDDTFELDPDWLALQRWWIVNELALCEKYALDPKLSAAYRIELRELDAGRSYGIDLDVPRLETIRRLMTEALAKGEIGVDFFWEKSQAITDMQSALRALMRKGSEGGV